MELLYGKIVADDILERLRSAVSSREEKPGLAVILAGNDEASRIYVSLKRRKAHEIGMNFFQFDFPEHVEQEVILGKIAKLNADPHVHGIIVQLPLPGGFDTEKIISSIDPRKDVDGFHPENAKAFLAEDMRMRPVFPHAIVRLMKSSRENLIGKKAVVIANSDEFGAIMRAALRSEGMVAVYVLTQNIQSNLDLIGEADVVVSAVGSPGLLRGEMLKDGAIVIDGGIEKVGGKILGDVDFASTKGKSGYLSPVPGGVGPVTIACLLENVFLAFEAQQKEKDC